MPTAIDPTHMNSHNLPSGREYCDSDVKKLTLYNFEEKEAFNYPYILTSPRSLKACRLADIKPIELLHRSVEEITIDLNISIEYGHQIYADYEKDRLRKLDICRTIRKHLLTEEARQYENEVFDIKSFKIFLNRQTTEKLDYSRDSTPDLHTTLECSQSFSPCSPIPSGIQCGSIRKRNKKSPRPTKESSSTLRFSHEVKLNNSTARTSRSRLILPKPALPHRKNKNHHFHGPERVSNDQNLCWQLDKIKSSKINTINNEPQNPQTTAKSSKSTFKVNSPKSVMIKRNNKNTSKQLDQHQIKQRSLQKSVNNIECKSKLKLDTKNQVKKQNEEFNDSVRKKKVHLISSSQKKTEFGSNPSGSNGLKKHDLRILDAMFLSREKQQLEKQFSKKADIIWDAACNPSVKINSSNKATSGDICEVCTCNENVAFNSYLQQIKNKMKQIKEDSLNKELHGEQVRQLARELQAGMEQWQDRVLLLQWRAIQRAKINARLNLESKRLKTQTENNEKTLLHALRFRNVQDMERIKQQIMMREIEDKDYKIKRLKIKREREILDCKTQAHYTAELRDQLRKTFTPETFDKKVNNAMIQSQFINRSLTSSPFVESHIRLG